MDRPKNIPDQETERQQGVSGPGSVELGSGAVRQMVEKPKHAPFHTSARAGTDDIDVEPSWYLHGGYAGVHHISISE